ncbi:hypothetical protein BKA69DRAFT_854877 [Paraphysoderma sedebokerense]|nr:hypothetical protein BKA69DRAFT_854877 [Paraphysoderma sedebokerense]
MPPYSYTIFLLVISTSVLTTSLLTSIPTDPIQIQIYLTSCLTSNQTVDRVSFTRCSGSKAQLFRLVPQGGKMGGFWIRPLERADQCLTAVLPATSKNGTIGITPCKAEEKNQIFFDSRKTRIQVTRNLVVNEKCLLYEPIDPFRRGNTEVEFKAITGNCTEFHVAEVTFV